MDRYVFLHQKIKELDPLSSMATQPTHPSLIKVLFYLSFKSGMNSIGWHSVLTYLQSSPIALILQAARLWYYDYYISFSFFSLVQALWFHLKVHWHRRSEEFHLSAYRHRRDSLAQTTAYSFPELCGHMVQHRKILVMTTNVQFWNTCRRHNIHITLVLNNVWERRAQKHGYYLTINRSEFILLLLLCLLWDLDNITCITICSNG